MRAARWLVSVFGVCLLTSCGGGGSSGDTDNPQPAAAPRVTSVTYYPETDNPLIVGYTLPDGTVATLLGKKNPDGTLQRPEGMLLQAKSADDPSRIQHDKDGRITKAAISGVGVILFDWQDNERANVTAVLETGDIVSSSIAVAGGVVAQSIATRRTDLRARALQEAASEFATLSVSVQSDAPETGAVVWADILGAHALVPTRYPLDEAAPGVYETSFVNTPSIIAIEKFDEGCNSLVSAYLRVCGPLGKASAVMASTGCAALALAAAAVVGPEALALAPVCEAGFVNLGVACAAAQAAPSTGIPGAPNPTGPLICKGIESAVRLYDADGVRITAHARKGGRSGKSTLDVPGRATRASTVIALVPEYQTFSGTLVANGSALINFPNASPPYTCIGTISEQLDISVKVKSIGKQPPVATVTGHRGQTNTRPCGYNDFMNVTTNWNLGLTGSAPGVSSAHFATPFPWGTSTLDFRVSSNQDSATKKYTVQAEVSFHDQHTDGSMYSGNSGPMTLSSLGN